MWCKPSNASVHATCNLKLHTLLQISELTNVNATLLIKIFITKQTSQYYKGHTLVVFLVMMTAVALVSNWGLPARPII